MDNKIFKALFLIIFPVIIFITCEKPERILQFDTLVAEAADITFNTALLKGEITDLGSKAIEQHGLLLSESSVPAIGQQNTDEEPLGTISKKGKFQFQFTGLKANTHYYFRAFVVVDGSPEYASIKDFTTPDSQLPVVTAGAVSGLTMTSASLNGEVTSDGGEPSTVRGLCWGLSANTTITSALDTTKNGTGAGTFTGNMTGLTPGTQYYARTYAINSKGTIYSTEIPFKTHSLPVVATTAISDITTTGATSGGEVADDGGTDVTARGICWSTTTGPTTALPTKTSDGTGEGVFTSAITGLTSGSTYYVRAYATNQFGTSYGAEISFIADPGALPPAAVTNSATPVGTTTATLNGSVNANGLSTTVTFEYGITTSYGQTATASQNPVTGSSATPVSAALTGLSPSTTYHFRVKAVSTGGTAYGDDVTFNTTSTLPTVNDYDGNNYNVVTIGTQEWLQSNLKTEHYSNGEPVLEVTVNSTWGSLVSGAMSYYNNDESTYKSDYGGLYNWYAVTDIRNVCPAGWHAPTDAEWTALQDFLGGVTIAGGKLKESGISRWSEPNTDATNETGFTGLPGGYRSFSGEFADISLYGYWWTSTSLSVTDAYSRYLEYSSGVINRYNYSILDGFSVRCIKGALPLAVTSDAGGISSNSATLNAKVNPNNASATVTFEYGTTTSYGQTVTATQSPANGYVPVNVSAEITGLTESTTYYFRVKAVNSGGTVYGGNMAFNTEAAPVAPAATTGAASSVLSTSAVLNGTVNANNSSTTVTFEYGTSASYGTEVTADQNPVTGNTETSISKSISGLSASTTYHYRVKAVNAGGTIYGNDATFTTQAALPTVTDYDGNSYNIVTIGTQEWMQRNMLVTHYSNGDAISNITDNTTWNGLTTGACSWYNNDQATYKETYGALYNWYAVSDIRNVCPTGWHVPSDEEWTALSTYLDGESVAGGKLKEEGFAHWESPNAGATNETGFTALPGGERELGGDFAATGYSAFLWSATTWDANSSWARFIAHNQVYMSRSYYYNKYGYSVRCIKGAIPLAQTDSATAVASTSATLNGSVNPNGLSTTITIEYGTSTSYGSSVTPAQSPASGTAPVEVSASLSSLTPGITYNYRIKAENSAGTSYGTNMAFVTPDLVADVDGNVYNAVVIGTQIWMQGNLNTRKYNDNTNIPEVTDNTAWSGLSTPAYCWYNNDKSAYGDVYGALYNWYTGNTGKLCPTGWHVPTDAEWTTLKNYLIANGYNYDGTTTGDKTAKSLASDTGWNLSSYEGAVGNTDYPDKRNLTKFTALPGGARFSDGSFHNLLLRGHWWSTTEYNITNSFLRIIESVGDSFDKTSSEKTIGISVRCVKD